MCVCVCVGFHLGNYKLCLSVYPCWADMLGIVCSSTNLIIIVCSFRNWILFWQLTLFVFQMIRPCVSVFNRVATETCLVRHHLCSLVDICCSPPPSHGGEEAVCVASCCLHKTSISSGLFSTACCIRLVCASSCLLDCSKESVCVNIVIMYFFIKYDVCRQCYISQVWFLCEMTL